MATPWLFVPPRARARTRARATVGVTGSLRSWLASVCCLGAAAGGLALSIGLGRCEAGSTSAANVSTLAPIMQTRGHPPAGCSRGSKAFTNVNPVR